MSKSNDKDFVKILKEYWGYDSFRPLQEDIIQASHSGKDVLALMPTGGGKSICFQVPALAKEGVCIVISPLIALMKDQVQNLKQRGIDAEAVYSGMRYSEIDRILDNCIYGKTKLLYLSPERLLTDMARARIQQMNVNLIAVDEAHCISQWGYDFRPPYLSIPELRELIPDVPVLALTATATEQVVDDIQDKLAFKKNAKVFTKSFKRDNLSYVVLHEEAKLDKMADILKKVPGTAIVYVRSRMKTQEIAHELSRFNISAAAYHAGMSSQDRSKVQESWMQNKTRVIVATNAFGMGIDKPDVRTVIHIELPDSLEAYFQEAGRAGRDGKRAYAVLLYQENDKEKLLSRFEGSYPELSEIRRVYQALGSYFQLALGSGEGNTFDFDIQKFCNTYQLKKYSTYSSLKIMEREGWITLTDAVFIAATLMVKVNKEQLYDYQLRNPSTDKLLKTILRTYQGAFIHAVKIDEFKLAHFLKVNRAKLQSMLKKLTNDGIIEYEPMKDQPQLFFVQPRVPPSHLNLDYQRYNFLKKRQEERISEAIHYADSNECRSILLLRYFNEKATEPCGRCDVCTGRRDREMSQTQFNDLQIQIEKSLTEEKKSVNVLIDSFSPSIREKALHVLEYLIQEGIVISGEDGLRML